MGYQIASVGLAPVFMWQGRGVRRLVPRLPEASGPRSGVQGAGPTLRLLIVGDSAAAGVGAPTQHEALSGRLVDALASDFHLTWEVIARIGATTAGTARHLARRPPDTCGDFDVAVVSLGLNDVTGRRPLNRWLADVAEVCRLLRERFAVRQILLSGLPPMHLFPALPQPLRWYLGGTARRFDRALAAWVADRPDCEHVSLELRDATGLLATDGLHPGPAAFQQWSDELVPRIRARWAPPVA